MKCEICGKEGTRFVVGLNVITENGIFSVEVCTTCLKQLGEKGIVSQVMDRRYARIEELFGSKLDDVPDSREGDLLAWFWGGVIPQEVR